MNRFNHFGAGFEEIIDWSNKAYEIKGQAIIQKIPTPWKVKRGYNPRTKKQEIFSAFPEEKSTVDFGGTASGKSIWFDAKTTQNKKSFPIANIKKHQMNFLKKVQDQDGLAFFIIYSTVRNKTWLLWHYQLVLFMATESRKSITFDWLDLNCKTVQSRNGIMLDYLQIALEDVK